MNEILLTTHSWLRWIILLLAVIVIIKSFIGWKGGKSYTKGDNALSAAFIGTLHLQLLLGLILYFFVSSITQGAFQDFGAAMKNAAQRYWAVEHIFAMILGVVIAQIGRTKSKKSSSDTEKFKKQAIFYLIAILIILSRIPFNEPHRLY
jgi:uncharacterized protein YacL